jgi:hypothetical protein
VSESYVDLSYRGLPLGRRIKLAQVRPSTAYLELPTPMPVGTTVSIHSDDGMVLEALVRELHEQVGGSDRAPGMTIAPTLKDDAALAWWHARVTLPEAEPRKRTRDRPHTVRPRSATRPQPPPTVPVEPPQPPPPAPAPPPIPETRPSLIVLEQLPPREPEPRETPVIIETPPLPASIPPDTVFAPDAHRAMTIPDPVLPDHVEVEEIELPRSRTLLGMAPPTDPPPIVQDEAKRTLVMDALDQEALQKLSRHPEDTPPDPPRTISNDYPVEDDGLRTQHMDAVDVRALGLEAPSSGPIPVVAAAPPVEDDGDDDEPSASQSQPAAAQPEKKERGGFFRRRKKKR